MYMCLRDCSCFSGFFSLRFAMLCGILSQGNYTKPLRYWKFIARGYAPANTETREAIRTAAEMFICGNDTSACKYVMLCVCAFVCLFVCLH